MNEQRTLSSLPTTSPFRWGDLAYVGALVLMPYVLAAILLSV